ncbi:ATPase [Frondihabitans sp. PAMC 28766]|uniref:helicase HerA-like domain-containing protein n=1 Tax=Frondihabitans sp. PAMC 28766 TaxID=1795630 RepID=UPI00078B2A02|nr:helicase HerA-like domain-containing protein [Frondihabitans sp. PAMC 28766]AMM21797.1 ATPase [Frondihabitans sp. PAMC 28766]
MSDALQDAQAAAAAAVAAAEKAKQDAEDALARAQQIAAEATAAAQQAAEQAVAAVTAAAATGSAVVTAAAPAGPAPADQAAAPAPQPTAPTRPLGDADVATIRTGYAFAGPALEMGALVNGEAQADVPIRIPLAMMNRHGLVAGATGTGKTKTLQVLAEQLSAAGVPVFAADVKGDLSGIATPGESNPKLLERTEGIGQHWSPQAAPTEYFALGGKGTGIPVRATVSGFGPILLSKVLGLNATQESSLGLVFHYAEKAGLALLDLSDLRTVLSYLTSDDGKGELQDLGGLSSQTVGVILRELITFADQGADEFFGEPEMDTAEFLRTAPDGRGIVSLLELPGVATQPALFSTFLMWMLADLYNDLPEVGDLDKPKLVFFFDEAHLLFRDASKDFLASITQTVRLIRSKGVGIVFVTQTPKDVPSEVLAQLGSRVQHQLRAFTPDDAKALKATVSTYPSSGYDLAAVLQSLATGEAIVTVMNEKGAPSPVAWTRLRAPQGSMSPTPQAAMDATVAGSPLRDTYWEPIDRESAREILTAKLDAAASAEQARTDAEAVAKAQTEAEKAAAAQAKAQASAEKSAAKAEADAARERAKIQAEYDRQQRGFERAEKAQRATKAPAARASTSRRGSGSNNPLSDLLGSSASNTIVREVVKGIFGTLRRR